MTRNGERTALHLQIKTLEDTIADEPDSKQRSIHKQSLHILISQGSSIEVLQDSVKKLKACVITLEEIIPKIWFEIGQINEYPSFTWYLKNTPNTTLLKWFGSILFSLLFVIEVLHIAIDNGYSIMNLTLKWFGL